MKPKSPLVFRLEPELNERLEKCSRETKLKKYTLALLAIEAAVDAIEANGYRLVVPIKFNVAEVPTPAELQYPPHNPQFTRMEEQRRASRPADHSKANIPKK